jgi:hypothetical protein
VKSPLSISTKYPRLARRALALFQLQKSAPKYVAYVAPAVLKWRSTGRAVIFSVLPALPDWRAGFLSGVRGPRIRLQRREDDL